jgi:putative ABC transport system ATP-binding protein
MTNGCDDPSVVPRSPVKATGCDGDVVLETVDITKCYDLGEVQVHALRGVDLRICNGEMLAIMGPSGSGKSTLMHMIGMLDTPTSGKVIVGGQDVSDLSPNRLATMRNKEIGFVFQSFNLLARTSAMVNVELPLVYSGIGGGNRSERAKGALERVGLEHRLGHYPSQLSGGQQQRVAIARALVTEPSIVLADEPTGNLDTYSGVEVMMMLQELHAQGITVVVVTHDEDIARHCERIVKLRDGHVIGEEVVEERLIAEQEAAEMTPEEAWE